VSPGSAGREPKAVRDVRISRYAGATHAGRKRRQNEDAYVMKPPLFAVADGMGGPRAGEVASGLAAAAVKASEAGGAGEDRVVALIQSANQSVYQRSSEDADVAGMGTTMTVALVGGRGVSIGHVGDSRAYLARSGRLEQLTEDHSLVSELVRAGKISPEEAENHPQRSVITRALGTDPSVDVDTFEVVPEEGDVFVICSDGLTTMVDDDTIARVLEDNRENLDRAAKELIRLANRAGGEDNITVVAFEVTDAPDQPPLDQTRPMPVVSKQEIDDTLDETDRVPAVDTMVVSPAEAERLGLGGSAAQTRRKRRLWPLLVLLLVVIAAALILWFLAR
jgi:PPM family protein phosphatase